MDIGIKSEVTNVDDDDSSALDNKAKAIFTIKEASYHKIKFC